jgi:arylsulfatase B
VTTWLRRTALPDGSQGRWTSPNGRIIWSTHLGTREPDYDADNPILRNSQPVDEPEYLTDAFTREAESFLERHRAQPFFLYLAYNAVHSPLQGADRYMARFAHIGDIQRRLFAAMLAQLDDSVGRLLGKLRDLDLDRQTLVIFLSDNGGPTRELTSSNAPLRGGKGQLFEGGVRVPFLMRWPGRLPASAVEERVVSSLDIYPTALAAANVATPQSSAPRDGADLLPYLTSDQDRLPHKQLYWRVGNNAALRQGAWKIVRQAPGGRTLTTWRLYHLAEDLGEVKDLAHEQAEVLARLADAWTKINETMLPLP